MLDKTIKMTTEYTTGNTNVYIQWNKDSNCFDNREYEYMRKLTYITIVYPSDNTNVCYGNMNLAFANVMEVATAWNNNTQITSHDTTVMKGITKRRWEQPKQPN